MSIFEDLIIDIENVQYVEAYKLRLNFSDSTEKIVDFEPFLRRSLNPLITKYLDRERFKAFSIENGDLQWDDYDLCFPISDLYEGTI